MDTPRWDIERHNKAVAAREAKLREEQVKIVEHKCLALYQSWRKKAVHCVTMQDYVDSVEDLKARLTLVCEGYPEQKDWLGATCFMLDESIKVAAKRSARERRKLETAQKRLPKGRQIAPPGFPTGADAKDEP